MVPEDTAAWRDRRTDAASAKAEGLARRQAAESAQARELIAQFVAEARRRGVRPVTLRARSYDGRRTYRTSTEGWYLRRDRSAAVGTDGEFYLLGVPASLLALGRGARLEPSDPPLVLGRGGRDGDSIDLVDALRRALGEDV